jgi:hypothetical protein
MNSKPSTSNNVTIPGGVPVPIDPGNVGAWLENNAGAGADIGGAIFWSIDAP